MTSQQRAAGYDRRHFEKLAQVEDRHFWFTSRNRMLAGVLDRIALPEDARVLEIGSGTGNTLRVLERAYPRATLVGVDLYDEGFGVARQRTAAHLVRAAIEHLPFVRPFHLVAAFDVLEHVADDGAALECLRKLLTEDGWLVVTVPAFAHLWSRFDEDSHHVRRYAIDELRDRLREAGYHTERATFFMAALYPLLRAARLAADRFGGDQGRSSPVARELRVMPIVNPVMTAILDLEASHVARGGRLPIGTSLLAVARRR
jgi:trans-aconitate methyltransferase